MFDNVCFTQGNSGILMGFLRWKHFGFFFYFQNVELCLDLSPQVKNGMTTNSHVNIFIYGQKKPITCKNSLPTRHNWLFNVWNSSYCLKLKVTVNENIPCLLLYHCSLLWDWLPTHPSDMQLKMFPEKPIRQRLVILRLQAASVVVSQSESAPLARTNHVESCVISVMLYQTWAWLGETIDEWKVFFFYLYYIFLWVFLSTSASFARLFCDLATVRMTVHLSQLFKLHKNITLTPARVLKYRLLFRQILSITYNKLSHFSCFGMIS